MDQVESDGSSRVTYCMHMHRAGNTRWGWQDLLRLAALSFPLLSHTHSVKGTRPLTCILLPEYTQGHDIHVLNLIPWWWYKSHCWVYHAFSITPGIFCDHRVNVLMLIKVGFDSTNSPKSATQRTTWLHILNLRYEELSTSYINSTYSHTRFSSRIKKKLES
jgi:hypothetical protein